MKRFPDFFKVYLPEHSSNRLKIPDAFISHLNRLIPEKVILSNQKGKLWHVDVGYSDKGAFFLNGWRKFQKDNYIDTGDFLVFQYNGDFGFKAKIFGRSGCEKITSDIVEVKVQNEGPEKKEEENEEEDYEDDNNNSVSDEDYFEEEEEAEEGDTEEEEETERCRGKKKISANSGGSKKRPAAKAGGSEASNDFMWEEVEVRKYIQHLNPYFVSKAGSGNRRNLLHVRSYVLKDFGLELATKIILRDEHGRKWSGKLVSWKDGRRWVSGWRTFCHWNNVDKDDCCICEFPQRGKMHNMIQVYIVRGVGSQAKLNQLRIDKQSEGRVNLD